MNVDNLYRVNTSIVGVKRELYISPIARIFG